MNFLIHIIIISTLVCWCISGQQAPNERKRENRIETEDNIKIAEELKIMEEMDMEHANERM